MRGHCLLEVHELTKSFFGTFVLHRVSFHVDDGEAVAIVGPNGAGKSTLLRCVVGAEVADEGAVRFEGAEIDESCPAVRAAVASLLDDADFFPDLSVVEHLLLYAWSYAQDHPDDVVAETLAALHLEPVRDRLPTTLSSGQRHRLGLAACLVRPRKLLVLDEPEARLDRDGQVWLSDRMNSEKRAGIGIVFATHSRELADTVADRTVDFGG